MTRSTTTCKSCNVSVSALYRHPRGMMSRTSAINHGLEGNFLDCNTGSSPSTPATGQVVSLIRLHTRRLSPARLATVVSGKLQTGL